MNKIKQGLNEKEQKLLNNTREINDLKFQNKLLKKRLDSDIPLPKGPLPKLDSDKMKETLKGKVIPNTLLEKRDSNIPLPKRSLSKLDPDDMIKILDNNERDKITKELYKNEAERTSATIKLFDKKIGDNLTMSNKEINIITQLKKLYELRGEYYVNKFNNEPEKNNFIDIKSIDNNIYQLENELRDLKGSGTFTCQNDFVKLLNLLAQLLTKNNSKKLKDDMSQLLKNLYDNKQITKQVYNNLIKAITYKNDS